MDIRLHDVARRGNALVIGLSVIVLVGTMVAASTETFIARQRTTTSGVNQTVAVAALESVLTRRSKTVVDLASAGDPAAFATFTKNFGADIVGSCEVRWKIEPVRTPYKSGDGSTIPFIANPSPELSWSPPSDLEDSEGNTLNWQTNDYIYLYRVAAEARVVSESASATSAAVRPLARAQGVRYVAINNQPLFRWVIFYAAEGPKGDLELSHGSDLSVLGNVHSNGAIYLGSAPNTNTWHALKPSTGTTAIGPATTAWTSWAAGTVYDISDRVQHGSTKYKCTAQHVGSTAITPGSSAGWEGYWEEVGQARVTGVDGVFRVSKQTMYGAFNGFPMTGTAPGTFAADGTAYSLASTWALGEPQGSAATKAHYHTPAITTLAAATFDGAVINPNRLRDASGLQTSAISGSDTGVTINGNPIRGVPDGTTLPANDSRDIDRAADKKWTNTFNTAAPTGFESAVRQSATGGKVVSLPRMLQGRILEAQRIEYPSTDWASGVDYVAAFPTPADATNTTYVPGAINVVQHRGRWYVCISDHTSDATTEPGVGGSSSSNWRELAGEPHEYARPLFLQPDWTVSSRLISGTTQAFAGVEVPGKYLANALGSQDFYLKRRLNDTTANAPVGWDVVARAGTGLATPNQPDRVGLVIRERPVPDNRIYPSTSITPLTAAAAIPYAYGKHNRPSAWPFTQADVTSEAYINQSDSASDANGYNANNTNFQTIPTDRSGPAATISTNRAWMHFNELVSAQTYAPGGSVDLRVACNPGSNFPGGWRDSVNNLVNRQPFWYAENWRLVQLGKSKASTTQGLYATYFNDQVWSDANKSGVPAFYWAGPFGGTPVQQQVDFAAGGAAASYTAAPVSGCATTYFSVRWEGFIRPTTTGSYSFQIQAHNGARMWLDHERLIDNWKNQSGTIVNNSEVSRAVPLVAGQNYRIVMEFYNGSSAAGTSTNAKSCTLQWNSGAGFVTIPSDQLRTRLDDAATRTASALNWSEFESVEMRIDSMSGNPLQKVGLMIRGGAGFPELHDGREPYAAILYSPSRGFFIQARGERSTVGKSTGPARFVGRAENPGDGTVVTDVNGVVNTEDKNGNGLLDATPVNEDTSNPGFFDDPAKYRRVGRLIPIGPFDSYPAPGTNDNDIRYYTPSTNGATKGTNPGSGTSDARFVALTKITSPDFGISEGAVNHVYTGPLTLQTYASPQSSQTAWSRRQWYWVLDPTSLVASGTYPTDYTGITALFNSSDTQILRMFARDVAGTGLYGEAAATRNSSSAANDTSNPGLHDSGNINSTFPRHTGTTIAGTGIATLANQTAITRNYELNNTGLPGTAPDTTPQTYTTSGNVAYYLTSPADTRPKIYQGSTYVRTMTASELKTKMEETYGGTWTVATSLPAWPAIPDVDPAPPAATVPALPSSHFHEVSYLRATLNAGVTTPIGVGAAYDFRVGEYYRINSEWVRATAKADTFAPPLNNNNHTVSFARAQLGSTGDTHAANSSIILASPAALTAAATSTATTLNVDTTAAIEVGDILRLAMNGTTPNAAIELIRVTGKTATTLTVVRGITSTRVALSSGWRLLRPITRTFSLARQTIFTADNHSFVSASGMPNSTGWWWTNQAQYLPVSNQSLTTPTTTGGFQPNQWYGTTAPTSTSAAKSLVGNSMPASGRVTPSSGSTPGKLYATSGASETERSPRWSDDQPAAVGDIPQVAPFGTAQVWLRLERAGSNIRFLWRNGDSGAWTPITLEDGSTPASLQVAQWFAAPAETLTTNSSNYASGDTTTVMSVASAAGFRVNDPVAIINTTPATEIGLVTAVNLVGNTLTITRKMQSTAGITIQPGSTIRAIPADRLGPDLQIAMCAQGGPSYWTTLTASASAASSAGTTQTWSVTSNKGMQVGDILQVGPRRERVSVVSLTGDTLVSVARGADGMGVADAMPGYPSGTSIMCLSVPNANATSVSVSGFKIETTQSGDDEIIDAVDWDGEDGGAQEMSKYLASQYQVLWGRYDITEHFFSANENSPSDRLASEEWLFNPREFWSQSPWWDDAELLRKDPDAAIEGGNDNGIFHDQISNRIFLGKTTWLTVNMAALQTYLKNTVLNSAVTPTISGGSPAIVPGGTSGLATLASSFNGLIYVARTNRYPWNPLPGAFNPWNQLLPNGSTELLSGSPPALTNDEDDNYLRNLNVSTATVQPLLQPYTTLRRTPAFKPQDFSHGVRIKNGASIDWGYPTSGSAEFGLSKTTICTPNQLFVQGDYNSVAHTVSYKGGTPDKLTPCALMGDSVTLLSNAWSDANFTQPGLNLNSTASYVVSGGGTLAFNQVAGVPLPTASTTSFFTSILTHNQPTTRTSVRAGESSAFINTLMYLEDWVGADMRFLGSLVVMDSRRYSDAYLLEASKMSGLTPFGYTGSAAWLAIYGADSTKQWSGTIGAVQGPPNRLMDFNYDLLTEQGTPPFTPFGVTASGVGSWTRVIE